MTFSSILLLFLFRSEFPSSGYFWLLMPPLINEAVLFVPQVCVPASGARTMEFGSKDVEMVGANAREEALPALLIRVPSQAIAGFDCVAAAGVSLNEVEGRVEELQGSGRAGDVVISIPAAAARSYDDAAHVPYSVSLSMPASPSGFHLSQFRTASARRVEARVAPAVGGLDVHPVEEEQQQGLHPPRLLKQTRFHSQPILNLHPSKNADDGGARRGDGARDKRFDPFKTFSGRLERQLSNLRGRPQEPVDSGASPDSKISEEETDQVPAADRYFDALEGPELDTLRVSSKHHHTLGVTGTCRFRFLLGPGKKF